MIAELRLMTLIQETKITCDLHENIEALKNNTNDREVIELLKNEDMIEDLILKLYDL